MTLQPATRISLCLALVLVGVLLAADMIFGLSPSHTGLVLDARKKVTESMAVQSSILAARGDAETLRETMEQVVERNDDVLSAALLREGGNKFVATKEHDLHWLGSNTSGSTPTHARVKIFNRDEPWGELQLRYVALGDGGWLGAWTQLVHIVSFCAVLGFLGFYIFMRRSLRHLDPSSVIPSRVKATLDVLSEGVVLVDKSERIVLANEAFTSKIGRAQDSLVGTRLSDFAWHRRRGDTDEEELPWTLAINRAQGRTGATLAFPGTDGKGHVSFVVNSSPILDESGGARGALTTFDDITEVERTNVKLQELLDERRLAEAEILRQNQRLEVLATRDGLTNCYNRRALFERFKAEIESSRESGESLSCIMCDIDHFKSVNDNFGHAVGDDIIRYFAETLNSLVRTIDLVGRYGGEEFCLVLPGQDVEQAVLVAERLRQAIELNGASMLPGDTGRLLTASFGVAAMVDRLETPDELVNRADRALYRAKTEGRNRVSRSEDTLVGTSANVLTA